MSEKTIADLRNILFDAIEGVKKGTMPVDKAQIISSLADVMVRSAKVEVDYAKATGGTGSGFLESAAETTLPPGITGSHTHRIR